MIAPGDDGHHHRSAGRAQPPQRGHPRKLTPASPGAAVEMIATPTPANCNFTELQHRPIEKAKASKGEALVGHVTIADGSAKSVLRGVAGSLARSWRAPIAFATVRAWPCGGKLAIHERYRMARAVHVGHNRQLCFQRVGPRFCPIDF